MPYPRKSSTDDISSALLDIHFRGGRLDIRKNQEKILASLVNVALAVLCGIIGAVAG